MLPRALFCAVTLLSTAWSMPSLKRQNDAKVGYLLTTFPVQDEAIYMYLSNGNDAHTWTERSIDGTAAKAAILRSDVGSRGVRDSQLVPSRDGSKFWLLATDLNVNTFKGRNFAEATRFGSRSLVIWESDSTLAKWSRARLTPPLVNVTAGNVWAPAAVWEPLLNAYIVVFASRFWNPADTKREGKQPPNRLMYVTTSDFNSFSEAREYYYPGYPVIDATFLPAPEQGQNVWYRWVKTEVDNTIYQERSANGMLGKWSRVGNAPQNERITFAKQYANNEAPLVFRDNVDKGLYHLWIDENTRQTYIPATARTLDDMAAWRAESRTGFPANIKHGSVTAINRRQYDAIAAKYPAVKR